MAKAGLYSNIHKKQERIEQQKAAGKTPERMRTPGAKGAPTAAAFKQAAPVLIQGRTLDASASEGYLLAA